MKLVVIGMDAAEPSVLLELAQKGLLPTFKRLSEKGVRGALRAPDGQYAGTVWPTLFTGMSEGQHGRYFFTQFRPDAYAHEAFTPDQLKAAPFWDRFDGEVGPNLIVDVPKAPLLNHENMVQLLDWGCHDPEYEYVRCLPGTISSEVEALVGKNPVASCDRLASSDDGLGKLRDLLLARTRQKAQIIKYLLKKYQPQFSFCVFSESHCAGHQFWHLHDTQHPRHARNMRQKLGDPLRDVYVGLDSAMAEVLEHVPEDAICIVLTSHGMGPHYDGSFLLNQICERLQVMPKKRDRLANSVGRGIWRRLPKLGRARMQRSIRAVAERQRSRTRPGMDFFPVRTNDNCGGIRINVIGRESQGRVARGVEFEALCDRIDRSFRQIVNAETGKPIVKAVLRTDRLVSGPRVDDLPDLNIVWSREAPIRRIYSPEIGTIKKEFTGRRTGDHRINGYWWAFGPGIAPDSRPRSARSVDLAKTCCQILGIETEGLEGEGLPLSIVP